MRTLMMIVFLAGSARAQQLVMPENGPENIPQNIAQDKAHSREAESILISSCRIVGEKLEIAMPDPRVELRVGERINAVESYEGKHVIHMKQWSRALFKQAALHVCLRAAEDDLVPALATKVRDR